MPSLEDVLNLTREIFSLEEEHKSITQQIQEKRQLLAMLLKDNQNGRITAVTSHVIDSDNSKSVHSVHGSIRTDTIYSTRRSLNELMVSTSEHTASVTERVRQLITASDRPFTTRHLLSELGPRVLRATLASVISRLIRDGEVVRYGPNLVGRRGLDPDRFLMDENSHGDVNER